MARTITIGFEGGSTFVDNINVSGSGAAFDTTTVRSGLRSLRCDSGGANFATSIQPNLVGSGERWVRAALNFGHLPASTIRVGGLSGSASGFSVRLTSAGNLQFLRDNGGGVQIGSDYAITTGVWYVVEVYLKVGAGATDTAECRVTPDGGSQSVVGAATNIDCGSDSFGGFNWGWVEAPGANKSVYVDDVAINDATGAANNSWCGTGKVINLVPTSDNTRDAKWTGGAGGTTALYDAVNNTPPIGTASASATNLTQIEHAGSATGTTDRYDANMTTYAAAGVGASDTIVVAQIIAAHGEDIATGTKVLNFSGVSNPVIAQAGFTINAGGDVGACGNFSASWAMYRSSVVENPSVTIGTAPVVRAVRPETASRVASVCYLALLVEYLPPSGPAPTPVSAPDTGTLTGTDAVVSVVPTSVATGPDTGTITGTEAITALASDQTRPDTGTLTGPATATIDASRTSTDTGTLTGTDTATVTVSLTMADTGTLSGTDGQSVQPVVDVARSDTGTLSSVDALALDTSRTTTDTGTITGVELSSVVGSASLFPSSDIGTLSGVESPTVTGSADLTRSDTGTLTGSESVASATSLTRTDTGTLTGADSVSVAPSSVQGDSGTLTGIESATVTIAATIPDTGFLSGSESSSVDVQVTLAVSDSGSLADALQIAVVEAAASGSGDALFDAPNSGRFTRDNLTDQSGAVDELAKVAFFGVASGVQTAFIVALSPETLAGTETQSVDTGTASVPLTVNDTGSITGVDVASVAGSAVLAQPDTGTITGVDVVALVDASAAVARSDTGTISGSETPAVSGSAILTRPDTGTMMGSEAVAALAATLTQADTGLLTGVDGQTSGASTTVSRSDTGTMTGAEAAPNVGSQATVSRADTGTITGADTQSVVQQTPVSRTDTGAMTGVDGRSLATSVDRGDAGTLIGSESSSHATTINQPDAGTITGVDVSTALGTGAVTRADTGFLTGSEVVSLVVPISRSDVGSLTGSEILDLATSTLVSDVGRLTGVDVADVVFEALTELLVTHGPPVLRKVITYADAIVAYVERHATINGIVVADDATIRSLATTAILRLVVETDVPELIGAEGLE